MDQFELSTRFNELSKKLDGLIEQIRDFSNRNLIKDWLSEKEAQQLLGLKNTSLWSLRKLGQVRYSKIGGKTFYNVESIKRLLEKNKQ